jgi:hypothetical protein
MGVYDTVADEDALAILDSADEEARRTYGEDREVYWDWESLRKEAKNAYLIDYNWPSRGRVAGGTLYHSDAEKFQYFPANEEALQVVHAVPIIEGIEFGAMDKVAIRAAFHDYVSDVNAGEKEGERSYNCPVSELAPYLPPSE